jgi:putative membrane protein
MTAGSPTASSPLRLWPLVLGLALLATLWLGPLPERARGSFAAHMVMHMGIVAVAAPLLVLGLLRLAPGAFRGVPPTLALAASFAEFVVVWGWHAPALHDAARVSTPLLLAEQASFLFAGLFVWLTAIGTASGGGALAARAAGVAALLVTSMHMTLLGALLLFSPRPLYACADLCAPAASMTPVEDQALGGVIMLVVGGISYLAGGLILLASVLRGPSGREPAPAFAGGRNAKTPGMPA